jgi:hypothetical protein
MECISYMMMNVLISLSYSNNPKNIHFSDKLDTYFKAFSSQQNYHILFI